MASHVVRKSRIAPAVEPLEGRRLLSLAGLPSGWGGSSSPMAAHAEPSSPLRGPMSEAGADFSPGGRLGMADRGEWPQESEAASDAKAGMTPGGQDRPAFPAFGLAGGTSTADRPFDTAGGGMAQVGFARAAEAFAPTSAASPLLAEEAASSGSGSGGGISPRVVETVALATPALAAPSYEPPARAVSVPGSVGRSVAGLAPTPRSETSPSDRASDDGPTSTVDVVPTDQGAGAPALARLPGGAGGSGGQGAPSLQGRPVVGVGIVEPKGTPEGRSAAEPPLAADREPGDLGSLTGEGPATAGVAEGLGRPDPHMADLIVDLLPFDRSALDGIVDRFLGPLDGISAALPSWDGPTGLLAASLAMAVAVLTVDASIRIRRAREAGKDDDDLVAFPGLPGLGRGAVR